MAAPVWVLTFRARSVCQRRLPSVLRASRFASTPLVVPIPSARYAISEILPLMTSKRTSRSNIAAVSLRKREAPTPTGSNTTGRPSLLASFPAASMDCTVRSLSVPMFSTSAEQCPTICSTSRKSSAIMNGDTPKATQIIGHDGRTAQSQRHVGTIIDCDIIGNKMHQRPFLPYGAQYIFK